MKPACVESVNLKTLVSLGIQSSCLFEKAMAHRPTHPTLDGANCEHGSKLSPSRAVVYCSTPCQGRAAATCENMCIFVESVATRVEPC